MQSVNNKVSRKVHVLLSRLRLIKWWQSLKRPPGDGKTKVVRETEKQIVNVSTLRGRQGLLKLVLLGQ